MEAFMTLRFAPCQRRSAPLRAELSSGAGGGGGLAPLVSQGMAWQNRTLVRRPGKVRPSTLPVRRSRWGWRRHPPPALPTRHVVLAKSFLETLDVSTAA